MVTMESLERHEKILREIMKKFFIRKGLPFDQETMDAAVIRMLHSFIKELNDVIDEKDAEIAMLMKSKGTAVGEISRSLQ